MIWRPGSLQQGARRATTSGNSNAAKIVIVSILLIMVTYFVSMQRLMFSTPVSGNVEKPALHLREHVVATVPSITLIQRNWTRRPGRRYVWIDVAIDNAPVGRIIAELYMEKVPKTAENFRALVTGDNEYGWSYKKSKCHRILHRFIVQCGSYDEQGGTSIYGHDFEDEEAGLKLKHSKRYILQMANAGPNTNGAQFCFMLGPAEHLNGKHVVFGEVVDGFHVVDRMEDAGVNSDDDDLTHEVMLVDGGEIFY